MADEDSTVLAVHTFRDAADMILREVMRLERDNVRLRAEVRQWCEIASNLGDKLNELRKKTEGPC